MKRLEKEVIKKEIEYTWEASDGTTFNTLEACKKHEETYFCTLKTWFMEIPHKKICGCDLGIPYCTEEDECYLFVPASESDVKKINLMIAFVDKNEKLLELSDVGNSIVMNFGYDGCCAGSDYVWWKRVDDLISGIRNGYDKITKEVIDNNVNV